MRYSRYVNYDIVNVKKCIDEFYAKEKGEINFDEHVKKYGISRTIFYSWRKKLENNKSVKYEKSEVSETPKLLNKKDPFKKENKRVPKKSINGMAKLQEIRKDYDSSQKNSASEIKTSEVKKDSDGDLNKIMDDHLNYLQNINLT